jgi:hypothetical protein
MYLYGINNLMIMMKSIENKGITATVALKNEVAGKASMPEVRRIVVTNRLEEDARIVSVQQILETDKTLANMPSLSKGQSAFRTSKESLWEVQN